VYVLDDLCIIMLGSITTKAQEEFLNIRQDVQNKRFTTDGGGPAGKQNTLFPLVQTARLTLSQGTALQVRMSFRTNT